MSTVEQQKSMAIIAKTATEISGLKIIATGLHGSTMRGYTDPNSDIDVCLLVERPISDYLNVTQNNHFKGNAEERRAAYIEFSSKVTKQTGINAMVSLVDVKELLLGLISNNPFSLCAYDSFKENNPAVKKLFEHTLKEYEHNPNKIGRLGASIQKTIVNYGVYYANDNDVNTAYRKERTYLGIYWHMLRLLTYIDGDRVNARSLDSLLELAKPVWQEKIPELFLSAVTGVYKARKHRNHFELPVGISSVASDALIKAADKVLAEASTYLTTNPVKGASSYNISIELMDLYNTLLDISEAAEPVAA